MTCGTVTVIRGGREEAHPAVASVVKENVDELPRTYVLAIILCAPAESEKRRVIRDTWIKLNTKGMQGEGVTERVSVGGASAFVHRFVVGTAGLA